MRIAVTGAGGGVGRAFLEGLPSGVEAIPLTHRDLPVEDRAVVTRTLTGARPDAILHLAAMTSVDGCEDRPELAFRVNALGTANVALAARRTGALLVALSTDYVFDGTKGAPYHEFDRPNPVNEYGRSKLAGEAEARALAPEHLVVRTAWIFGAGDDFVTRAVRRLAAGETVGAIADLTGTPTHVVHLAERLVPLIRSGVRGVVHLAGPRSETWFGLLARAVDVGGLPGRVTEQKAGDLGRPAPRPPDASLSSLVLPGSDVPPMPPLEEAVKEVVARHGRG